MEQKTEPRIAAREVLTMLPTAFLEMHPVDQALVAGVFAWSVTALGAGLVFFTRRVDQRVAALTHRISAVGIRGSHDDLAEK